MKDSPRNKKLTKLYYSIGEVAEMFDVNPSLIRFWEKEFEMIKPKKNKKGNRLFTQKDIKQLETIYQFVKIEGYTLEGAKQQLKGSAKESSQLGPSNRQVIESLELIRKELLKLKERL